MVKTIIQNFAAQRYAHADLLNYKNAFKERFSCKIKVVSIENYAESEVFSLALMLFTVVNHIVERDSLQKSFINIFNSLKKGGILIRNYPLDKRS